MASHLTHSSPFSKRFLAWMNERFPPAHAVLFLVLYLSAVLFGAYWEGTGKLKLGLREWLGFVGAYSFFLMLRVFDEHKDYELDLANYPDRVLQRGLITLDHLKVVGGMAIAAQLVTSVFMDGGLGTTTALWAVVIIWSALMAAEFFMGEWLQQRLLLYAISHMLVMPMALMWMAQMGAGGDTSNWRVILLALLAFFSGFAFELARKTRSPEDERDGVDSYTKVFGTRRAPLVTIAALLVGACTLAWALVEIQGEVRWLWMLAIDLALVLPIIALVLFARKPSAVAAKRQEGACSLYMLVGYVLLISAMVAERGVTF